jgi:hypothetical protein
MAANCVKMPSAVCFGLVCVLSSTLAILCFFRRLDARNDFQVVAVEGLHERADVVLAGNKWPRARYSLHQVRHNSSRCGDANS